MTTTMTPEEVELFLKWKKDNITTEEINIFKKQRQTHQSEINKIMDTISKLSDELKLLLHEKEVLNKAINTNQLKIRKNRDKLEQYDKYYCSKCDDYLPFSEWCQECNKCITNRHCSGGHY